MINVEKGNQVMNKRTKNVFRVIYVGIERNTLVNVTTGTVQRVTHDQLNRLFDKLDIGNAVDE